MKGMYPFNTITIALDFASSGIFIGGGGVRVPSVRCVWCVGMCGMWCMWCVVCVVCGVCGWCVWYVGGVY